MTLCCSFTRAAAHPAGGAAPGQYKRVAIVTGSEGGFSVEEAEAAKAAGAVTVGLGPEFCAARPRR
ncbi:hypothetical protein NIA69_09065 [Gemmiger formicilis]|nr:hypothetical protein [Gemmiger formicilis]